MPRPVVVDPATVKPLRPLVETVQDGMRGCYDRWQAAHDNGEFFAGRNASYIERREGEDQTSFAGRPKRTSKLTRRVVRLLARMYTPGPTRRVENSARVNAWLDDVYRDTNVNAVLMEAEREATLNHACALEIQPTGDGDRPINLVTWKAEEFEVWCDDCTPDPWAVVTKAVVDGKQPGTKRRKYMLWSAAEMLVFYSKDFTGAAPDGQRADYFSREESVHPCPGVLPFAFIHNETPVTEFWSGGIGTPLRECNAEIDRELSDLAEHVAKFLNPFGFLRNVPASTRFLSRVGNFMHLKGLPISTEDGANVQPDAFYLQANLAVEQAWLNIKSYADMLLEEMDVPATVVRSDASTDLSGVAIIAKMIPLLDRLRDRQNPYTLIEERLAAKILAVAALFHGRPMDDGDEGMAEPETLAAAAELLAAAMDLRMTVLWPEPSFPLPTTERDEEDRTAIEMGWSDPIQVLAKRCGLTIEQAIEQAKEIAKRRQLWAEIMGLEEGMAPPGKQPAPNTDPEGDDDEGGDKPPAKEEDDDDPSEEP